MVRNNQIEKLDVPLTTLKGRKDKGWPQERWAEKKRTYEITFMGKVYKSINVLAEELGIKRETLSQRIRLNWPEDKWGEVGAGAFISTGYTWEEAPEQLKKASKKLSAGLNISEIEAYQLLLEKINF